MSAKPIKVKKVVGNQQQFFGDHPQRIDYDGLDTRPMNPMNEKEICNVWTPFYDRADFTMDNAARRQNNKTWRIPEGQGITRRLKDNG